MRFLSRRLGLSSLFAVVAVGLAVGCQGSKPPLKTPPPPKVTVALPIRMDVQKYGEYTGYLESVQRVEIVARVRGFLEKVLFQEGTEVEQGAPLYEIDPREYKAAVDRAEAELDRAKSDLRKATSEEERAYRLRKTSAISEEEYISRQVSREMAKAAVEQADAALERAKLDLSFTTIKAPISGRISRTLVTPGNLVGYNEPTLLTTIVSVDPIYVVFDVPERNVVEYDRLARKKGLPRPSDGKIPVEVGVTTEEGYPHHGVIDFRENRIDIGTGTVRVRGRIPNTERMLSSGLFAHVRVPQDSPQSRLTLPEAAILSDQRGRYVWVVKPDNSVEYRAIKLGQRLDGRVAIEEGIAQEDWVIVNGVQRARPGAKVDPQQQPAPKKDEKK